MTDDVLTPQEIEDTINLFRAAGRSTIPVGAWLAYRWRA